MTSIGRANRLHFAREEIARLGNLVTPSLTLDVTVDPDDNRILECAVEAEAEFILTNDRHLLRLGNYTGIKIVRPHEFLDFVR
jgi:predicted nucleic acid-binding protein